MACYEIPLPLHLSLPLYLLTAAHVLEVPFNIILHLLGISRFSYRETSTYKFCYIFEETILENFNVNASLRY